jgi:ABC-type bacteriocin/lantibiotic exporter with double-glycine peptidase domain
VCRKGCLRLSSTFSPRSCLRLWIGPELCWLAEQIRPALPWHLASFLAISGGSLLALLTPLILKWLIDRVIPEKNLGLLGLAVVLIFLCHQGRIALANLGSYLTLSSAYKLALSLRLNLLRHLNSLSADYYETTAVGSVMYPLKEPIEEISFFGSDLVPMVLRMLLTTGMTLTTMLVLSPKLTLAVFPLIPAFLVARHYFRSKLVEETNAAQSDRILWSNFLEEHFSSAVSVQLLAQEKRQERKAFLLLARGFHSQQRVHKTGIWFSITSSLAVALAMCAVIGYGGRGVVSGTLSMGSLVAFYGFVTQLFDPLTGASEIYARAQKTFASIRQVQSTLSMNPTVTGPVCGLSVSHLRQPEIEFRAVEFAYRRHRGQMHIPSLRIQPGEHVAVVGENGAGKSTLGKLIVRLYDPRSGSIELGGEDIRNFDLRCLRKRVCYLPRESVLFDGTIASNLRFVRPGVPMIEVNKALEAVGLAAMFRSLPDGQRQRIGPGGCQLSGGERQRLVIARALLQQPDVLILDEATSCLDPATETLVLRNVRRHLNQSILIVVSHRLSTLAVFERVLTVANGRIVFDGRYRPHPIDEAALRPLPIPTTIFTT